MRYLNRIIDRYLQEWKHESDRKPQKDIHRAIRCSLENFGSFVSPVGKPISICPLYAISNL